MVSMATTVNKARMLGVLFEVTGDKIQVTGGSRLSPDLRSELRDHKPELLAYLQSSGQILNEVGVRVVYATTENAASSAIRQVLSDANYGPIGLDVETYVPPGMALPPELKLSRHGARLVKPKDEKTALDPHRAEVRLLQIYGGGATCAVLDMQRVPWETLEPLWNSQLVIHNSAFELGFFRALNIFPKSVECTMQAAGLMLGVHRRALAKAVREYLGWQMPKGLQTSDWGSSELSPDQLDYAALDAVAALFLWGKLERELKSCGRWDVYLTQRNSIPAAVEMKLSGLSVDTKALDVLIRTWSDELARARADWERMTGSPPPGTPNEIRAWLEGNLPVDELDAWPRTEKSALLKTTASALELAGHIPALHPLLAIKHVETLLSSFGSSLRAKVNPLTGRVHASYNVASTKSGRWSCNAPNLQNSPGERLAPGFRAIFRASEGRVLIGADYSQMELRAAAEISGDLALRKIYEDGLDLHKITAAAMADIDPNAVSNAQRSRAKPVNFGSIYGMGPAGLAAAAWNGYRIELTLREAKNALRAFFRNFPTLKRWMGLHADLCQERRRITIGAGRVFENGWEPEGIRYTQCCNLPVQGTCADVMMGAVSGVYQRLHTEKVNAIMVAQIHDELILEADAQDAEAVSALLAAEMTAAFSATFPDAPISNLVDVHLGQSWADLK
jgi:DNA polymerase I